ncbi:Adenine phosphoribosyltransferase [Mycobacteroides franklinii]|uniref:Adenine phosphoribosyltransferase n=2 Tax=Mycobacteroides franklinii TaxID=948102 RepID=A0A4R8R3G7_9MYCO|nr:Adenine phosphoribosyltransferase [Mycobacteroides franklinii]TDZ49068.1 Adenine phosphoribosyltransferase [Mycobacteroides franklinii]TDZ59249.1 Adenine phosphoribosyltransferase [Mycobacteroides franklinii]TDZ66763.1 Adenine phosphoribosyltransferase [Mycobacteroides franklinii]TDZ72686.1 Adenine phosphoribosyltransferase [Mycobacteroides franklinii]
MGRGLEHGSLGASRMTSADAVTALIDRLTRKVADFPEPGVQFKDLTPLFADADGLSRVTDALAEAASGATLIAGIDARGFLLGAAVAIRLGVGVLAVRKAGKLPPPVHSQTYKLEYGSAALEIPADGVQLAGHRVAIIDDVLATGGTLAATARLLSTAGAEVISAGVVLELSDLGGRAAVAPLPLTALRAI